MSRKYKMESRKTTVEAAIADAYSEMESLRDEVQEMVDNASEGLSQTQRIQTFSETADALSDADSPPDVPEAVKDLEVTYGESVARRGSVSRAVRASNAESMLQAAADVMEKWLEENEKHDDHDDVDSTMNTVREFADVISGTEWPGMYG